MDTIAEDDGVGHGQGVIRTTEETEFSAALGSLTLAARDAHHSSPLNRQQTDFADVPSRQHTDFAADDGPLSAANAADYRDATQPSGSPEYTVPDEARLPPDEPEYAVPENQKNTFSSRPQPVPRPRVRQETRRFEATSQAPLAHPQVALARGTDTPVDSEEDDDDAAAAQLARFQHLKTTRSGSIISFGAEPLHVCNKSGRRVSMDVDGMLGIVDADGNA